MRLRRHVIKCARLQQSHYATRGEEEEEDETREEDRRRVEKTGKERRKTAKS